MRVHESMDPDVGSRGAVDARCQASERRHSRSMRFGPMGHAGLSLLTVDHERPKLESLVRILRASVRVREVDAALSAHRALLRASRRPYDGVFLDMRMPELDGLEIISVLNAFAVPPAVVVVTESDNQALRRPVRRSVSASAGQGWCRRPTTGRSECRWAPGPTGLRRPATLPSAGWRPLPALRSRPSRRLKGGPTARAAPICFRSSAPASACWPRWRRWRRSAASAMEACGEP
jgi:CheY-like chemotaxis protein